MNTPSRNLLRALTMHALPSDLGIISHMVYKNYSAHRCQKYFGSWKKVDRHMYEFAMLKLNETLKRLVSNDDCEVEDHVRLLEYKIIKARKLLQEVENNCIETARHSLEQLHERRFISLHTLIFATVSNIWKLVRNLLEEIGRWLDGAARHGLCAEGLRVLDSKGTKKVNRFKRKRKDAIALHRFAALEDYATEPELVSTNNTRSATRNSEPDVGEVVTRTAHASLSRQAHNSNLLQCERPLKCNRVLTIKPYHIRSQFHHLSWRRTHCRLSKTILHRKLHKCRVRYHNVLLKL